jgi:hypothetical protein
MGHNTALALTPTKAVDRVEATYNLPPLSSHHHRCPDPQRREGSGSFSYPPALYHRSECPLLKT